MPGAVLLIICGRKTGDERRRNGRSARISTIQLANLVSGNNRYVRLQDHLNDRWNAPIRADISRCLPGVP
jgi:hypothetical protein